MLPMSELRDRCREFSRSGLDPRGERDQWGAPAQGPVRPVLVVVRTDPTVPSGLSAGGASGATPAYASRVPLAPSRLAAKRSARRMEVFRAAAPLFRQHGYRGVSLKAIGAACGLTPPALYRYFGSKLELALEPLSSEACFTVDRLLGDQAVPPLEALRNGIDAGMVYLDDTHLALGLAREIGSAVSQERVAAGFGRFRDGYAAALRRAAPQMYDAEAAELIESAIGIAFAAVFFDTRPDLIAVRARIIATLRPYVVRGGVPVEAYDRVMRPRLRGLRSA